MPRTAGVSVPKYRHHKASGQAIVTIQGRDHYLGPWKSKASRVEYDRLISEWMASGRPSMATAGRQELTVVQLLAAYWMFAEQHYRKDGEPTHELDNIRFAVRPLKELYGHTLVRDFGPLALKALQQRMIETKLSRGVVNQRIGKIKRVFRWAVSEELAPPSLCHALDTVAGLQRGRTVARETEPVGPVENSAVDATLPFLSPTVADMVRFQRLTGSRPNEVCIVRPCDIDRNGPVWSYRPASHKTEHHGRDRVICIGPKAQDVIRPYLLREATAYCFSPAEAEFKRREAMHAARKTPMSCGNRPGSNRQKKPQRQPGDRYTRTSYLYAIRRACDRAFPPPADLPKEEVKAWQSRHRWSPNQLRHAAATEIRRQFGLEAAQVTLGHSKADVTQVYAERDQGLAARIMAQVG